MLTLLVDLLPVWWVLRWLLRRRRYARYGVYLDGEIVKCTISTDEDSEKGFYLVVTYRFHAPQGGELQGTRRATRHDRASIPTSGTPVKILYVSDRQHEVM